MLAPILAKILNSPIFLKSSVLHRLVVTGTVWRKTDLKIATAPKTQSRSKDQNKDKDKFKVESRAKNLISLSLKASLNKFSRGSLVIRIGCL